MRRRPTRSCRTDTLFPYTPPFRPPDLRAAGTGNGRRGPPEGAGAGIAAVPRPRRLRQAARHRQRRGDLRPADPEPGEPRGLQARSEEHTSELQSLMRIEYAVLRLKKKKKHKHQKTNRKKTND